MDEAKRGECEGARDAVRGPSSGTGAAAGQPGAGAAAGRGAFATAGAGLPKTRGMARWALPVSAVLLVAAAFAAIFMGSYGLTVPEVLKILVSPVVHEDVTWTNAQATVVLGVRVPRILAAILIGAALSVSGATYQSVFKNPLVSPDLLGVAAGACVGAAIAILLHVSAVLVEVFALVGGLAAVLFSTGLANILHNRSTLILVLAGVIVTGFMNSGLGLIKYLADPETELPAITFWQLGSLGSVKANDVVSVAPPMLVALVVLVLLRWRIGILSVGDSDAELLGINVRRLRGVSILCSTVLTACAVCVAGTVGWIGLVIPHLCRFMVGADASKVLPLSITVGGLFLLVVDTVCRTIAVTELPLSVLIGFIGTPLFVWLIYRQRRTLA